MLHDPDVCLDFVRVFGNLPNVKSLTLLDESLNPIKELTAARSFLNNKDHTAFLNKIQTEAYTDIKIQCIRSKKRTAGGDFIQETVDGEILKQMSKVFSDINNAFPLLERDSKLDLVCQLDNGEYVLLEVQVITQDFWDSRALAYTSAFYGNQLKRGHNWRGNKASYPIIIAIHFLGKGGTKDITDPWQEFPDEVERHHVSKDIVNEDTDHTLTGLQLIQYCVPHLHKAGRSDDTFREWADFFQNANEKTELEVEQIKSEAVKTVYERARVRTMPFDVRQAYMHDTAKYGGYFESMMKEKKKVQIEYEGKLQKVESELSEYRQKVVETLLSLNMSDEFVSAKTNFTVDEVQAIRNRVLVTVDEPV